MAIVINGSGTVTGLSVGGLPDGTVDSDTLASGIEKTSISDSGDATAMTIDSSERIGIGRTSAGSFVDVYNTGNYTGLRVETTVGAEVTCQLKGGGTSSSANVLDIRNGSNGSLFEVRQDGRGLSQFTAKAWLNLSSGGTPSIDTSHNISTITDRANGMYTFTFSNSMNNSNYCVVAGAHAGAGTNDVTVVHTPESTKGVGSVQCHTMAALNSASTFSDSQDADVNMIIFGD